MDFSLFVGKHEYLNALATYGKTGKLSGADLSHLWTRSFRAYQPLERPVDYLEVLRLALNLSISSYDAQYLALADSLSVPLVTEDKALLKAAGGKAFNMASFLHREP